MQRSSESGLVRFRPILVQRATAALPSGGPGGTESLFTISGGRIKLISLVGEVTSVLENVGNNTKLISNPTTGTTTDLCAVLDLDQDEEGTLYTITNTITDAMQRGESGSISLFPAPIIVPIGVIQVVAAANQTGSIKWDLEYIPFDTGATVVAA